MVRILHEHPDFSDRFIGHMLARNIRIEEDLVDQLFNSSEKRLARTLLLLARYGKEDTSPRTVPKLSQETLAEMVGTTRSRVNYFMNKFRKLGFIEYRRAQDQQLAVERGAAPVSAGPDGSPSLKGTTLVLSSATQLSTFGQVHAERALRPGADEAVAPSCVSFSFR